MTRRKLLPFHCTCDACEKDYPISDQLKKGPISLPSVINEEQLAGDRNKSFVEYKLVVHYLEKIEMHIPCAEHVELWDSYLHTMHVIFGKEVELFFRVMANARRSVDDCSCPSDSDESLDGLGRLFKIE